MDKNVCSVFLFYESKSLFVTKPLYDPICHNSDLLLNPFNFDLSFRSSRQQKGKVL
jgi:hypothetical protein